MTFIFAKSLTPEKKWKALLKSNVTILKTNPDEVVIDKDSFVQIDNIIQIEYFPELVKCRRQENKLSDKKFSKVVKRYNEYKQNEWISDNRLVRKLKMYGNFTKNMILNSSDWSIKAIFEI